MDSQVSHPENEKLTEYNKLYSEFMSTIVDLHNYNIEFLKLRRSVRGSGPKIRNHYRKLYLQARKLKLLTQEVESVQRVLFPKKIGRPKTNKKIEGIPGSDNRRKTAP